MARKIYDCFTFFNELDILEIRLKQHYDCVDYFVIAESTKTFTGQEKRPTFRDNIDRFASFIKKVIYVSVDDMPDAQDPFVREHHQRRALTRGLVDANDDDLVMICDVDEILRAEAIEQAARFDGYSTFDMAMYAFFFNFREKASGWTAAYGFKKRLLNRIGDISLGRWDRSVILPTLSAEGLYQTVENAGWHFTHAGGVERLQQKLKAYSHASDPWPKALMSEGGILKHINAGGIIGNFKEIGRYVPIDDQYPQEIRAREEHYRLAGYIRDVYEAMYALQEQYRSLRNEYALYAIRDELPRPGLSNLPARNFLPMAGIDKVDVAARCLPAPAAPLISEGRPADQSSLSNWSAGRSTQEDAARALREPATGGFSCHTGKDMMPWWMVDLQSQYWLDEVRIFNRIDPPEVAGRASRLAVEVSRDGIKFTRVMTRENDIEFGGVDGQPLMWRPSFDISARFVRIVLLTADYLHFDRVEIFGNPVSCVQGQDTSTY